MSFFLKKVIMQKIAEHPDVENAHQLSLKTGVNILTMHRLVSGKVKNPRQSTLQPLAKFFNCPIEDFTEFNVDCIQKNISALVNLTHLNATELSKAMGSTFDDIRRLKNGLTKTPSDKILKPFCRYFAVTLDQIRGLKPIDFDHVKKFLNDKEAQALSQHIIFLNEAEKNCTPIPIISSVQAGNFTSVDQKEDYDRFYLPKKWVKHNHYFLLRVSGNSMECVSDYRSMSEGDLILVDCQKQPNNGSIVIATRDNQESTVKQYVLEKEKLYLKPLNKEFDDIDENNYRGHECKIIGVVIKIIPKIKNIE